MSEPKKTTLKTFLSWLDRNPQIEKMLAQSASAAIKIFAWSFGIIIALIIIIAIGVGSLALYSSANHWIAGYNSKNTYQDSDEYTY